MNQKPMIIFGDGSQTRDFTYVEDAMDAVLLAAVAEKAVGSVYNVGTESRQASLTLQKRFKRQAGIITFRYSLNQNEKWMLCNEKIIQTEKIHTELNWKKNHSIAEGIAKTYTWLKERSNN